MSLSQVTSECSLSPIKRTEITHARIVCNTCGRKCSLSWLICPVCETAPKLKVGDYDFRGAKSTLYDASTGPALSNSTVFLRKARKAPSSDDAADEENELQIATKIVPLDAEAGMVKMARREIQAVKSLQNKHPNLLPLLFGAETDTEMVLITPYAPGGDLHSLTYIATNTFKCLEEFDGGGLASQLLQGLAALHMAQYLHGDIKPHNVFLTRVDDAFVAQIGDFGLTQYVHDANKGVPSAGGTSGYKAPEIVGCNVGERPMVSFAVDLFAMGIMMYQVLSSMSPFDPPSNVHAPLEFDEICWEPLTCEAKEFVKLLLAVEPGARGSASSALSHPWLSVASCTTRGAKREEYAPQPDNNLRFHSAEWVLDFCGFSKANSSKTWTGVLGGRARPSHGGYPSGPTFNSTP
eukprot:gnl/MRDRNA2_/MRDRNA2_182320_c0_seq1.p1 gnl/MRDRNA2_/MRDRNA2_182320_c0~~gnl/MRDRNA2_/MRDRNA2_182320_c0_seq1.p1  ORF type:complete len:408 (+),score=51.06 gnl/MRDRNA2_/MRDRNA2_182320_c0_seq1:104-1327(+)